MKKIRIFSTIFLMIFALLFLLYWLKSIKGIDLIQNFSIGDYIPLKFMLVDNIIPSDQTGFLLIDDFESQDKHNPWLKIWSRNKKNVHLFYEQTGIDDSQCLVITSIARDPWTMRHNKLISAGKNDVFFYEGSVKVKGKDAKAIFSITLFDKNKSILNWHYANKRIRASESWTTVSQRFTLPPHTAFIRFRLTGSGISRIWFDNIKFGREKMDTEQK